MTEAKSSVRRYFVDEAGDSVLFNRKGQVLVGTPGCSRFFILGLLDVPDPQPLQREMETLRQRLLADPYFQGGLCLRSPKQGRHLGQSGWLTQKSKQLGDSLSLFAIPDLCIMAGRSAIHSVNVDDKRWVERRGLCCA